MLRRAVFDPSLLGIDGAEPHHHPQHHAAAAGAEQLLETPPRNNNNGGTTSTLSPLLGSGLPRVEKRGDDEDQVRLHQSRWWAYPCSILPLLFAYFLLFRAEVRTGMLCERRGVSAVILCAVEHRSVMGDWGIVSTWQETGFALTETDKVESSYELRPRDSKGRRGIDHYKVTVLTHSNNVQLFKVPTDKTARTHIEKINNFFNLMLPERIKYIVENGVSYRPSYWVDETDDKEEKKKNSDSDDNNDKKDEKDDAAHLNKKATIHDPAEEKKENKLSIGEIVALGPQFSPIYDVLYVAVFFSFLLLVIGSTFILVVPAYEESVVDFRRRVVTVRKTNVLRIDAVQRYAVAEFRKASKLEQKKGRKMTYAVALSFKQPYKSPLLLWLGSTLKSNKKAHEVVKKINEGIQMIQKERHAAKNITVGSPPPSAKKKLSFFAQNNNNGSDLETPVPLRMEAVLGDLEVLT